MTEETFKSNFAALLNVFPSDRITPETQSIYWTMLKGIPDERFSDGVRACLGSCKFFPTIAELGNASLPPIKKRALYNPHAYHPPRMVDWQEQVRTMERGQYQIGGEERKLLRKISLD